MIENTQKSKQSSFYLHSFRNRHLYPASNYPITHLLDRLNVDHLLLNQPSYVEHFKYTFILLLICTLTGTIFFRLHIQVYNTILGPFYYNQEQFIEYVNRYQQDQSFLSRFWKIEYIQVELNENNVQNPLSTYDTIRQFSDPRTRRNHIATYKRIKRPAIYVKLPTHSRKQFHARHRFHFKSYSIRTLQCIIRNLPSSSTDIYRTWIEKSDYIQHINTEYTKNSTEFNKAVLTKCGILIGYLYRPIYEKAFIPTNEHKFTSFDIALNMAEEYYSFYTFLICGLIFIGLFLKSLFYLIFYFSNIVRSQFLHRLGIFSFSLKLLPDVLEELWLLNFDGYPHEQLLQLERIIKKSDHVFGKNLAIIQNNYDHLFVVILKVNLNERLDGHDESSPFIICPVTDIRKITQYGGICYGKDLSWIHWPIVEMNEQNCAEWLHEKLMEISDVYKKRYEERLRYERDDEIPSYFTDQPLESGITRRRRDRQQNLRINEATRNEHQLSQLIREEKNIQRLKIERQNILENIENLREPICPANAEFIAKFRLNHEHERKLVDMDMVKKQIECTLCQEDLKLNDSYAIWPCPGAHLFHYDCMLKSLRMRNTCPNCRHEVEGVPPASMQAALHRFLSRLFT
ncbi:unnamed protein product [Rotaria sp. Silwood1]|nr:unnamed protein product [Rotaria sp. Silwood1]CAF4752275.1 unnamed protein product [Rotaria sp. Silwood1]